MENMHYDVGCKGLIFDSGVILCKGITIDAYYSLKSKCCGNLQTFRSKIG